MSRVRMGRIRFAALTLTLVLALLVLAGCGVSSSGPTKAGRAPTGVARGVTLYFLDDHDQLRPDLLPIGRLGSVTDAIGWLLAGPEHGEGLHTGIDPTKVQRAAASFERGVIRLYVPVDISETTRLGIDQFVCTALAAYIQGGGSVETRVQVVFSYEPRQVLRSELASRRLRRCPVIG